MTNNLHKSKKWLNFALVFLTGYAGSLPTVANPYFFTVIP